jgi:hypothetical protein
VDATGKVIGWTTPPPALPRFGYAPKPYKPPKPAAPDVGATIVSELAAILPALATHRLRCPLWMDDTTDTPTACCWRKPLSEVIVHLNDHHRWTREQIAGWLDTLDVDLTFPVPDAA